MKLKTIINVHRIFITDGWNIKTMYIKRDILSDVLEHLEKKEITLIVGPRQAGKTTLMKMVQQDVLKKGGKTIFLSLDFEKDSVHFVSQQALIQKLQLECGSQKAYIFIGEIQRKENAGLFLKGLYDMELPYKFIVSGSGSLELKEKIHESLIGRKRVFELSTITLHEFLQYKTDYKYHNAIKEYCRLHKEEAGYILNDYMNFGGYPRVVLENTIKEKTNILNEIYTSYIEKDISYLMKVEKIQAFKHCIRLLASQVGKCINGAELSSTLGIAIQTVKNYLAYAEKTFVIIMVSPFYRNVRKELTKMPVVYFNDIGLLNFINGTLGTVDMFSGGFVFQNLIFLLLKDRYKNTGASIHYWRTKDKAEVDFVINKGLEIVPVEVKYSALKNLSVSRSLRNFINTYSPKEAYIVNLTLACETVINNTKVYCIPWFELL